MGIRGTNYKRAALRRLAFAAAAASTFACHPAYAANQTGTATSVVVRPNTLVKSNDLDFGTLISGPTAGTATISPTTGARTTTGGVTTVGAAAERAVFQGTGGFLLITVTGDDSVTLTRAGGGTMTASLVRAITTSGGGVTLLGSSTTLLPSGVQTYYVGGTLTVPANQTPGDYSGTFTLTVNYF
ncbi:DUF4402 domain-containing protein [Sphingopyxis sp. DBS4]|uniref:DUF4402 domain-containing protein n=1 Tax=Sphingopyxis sp. DBS4 TaxID=2968500 RepID=UPI00214CADAC|nr:DUF4402 domain-containing protein [Sphingopyxis sp. DBS4]